MRDEIKYEEEFPLRLAQLRNQKGVSARDMSFSIGQNPGYINNIESGKALPSMAAFFYICEYLKITPQDFFDSGVKYPKEVTDLVNKLRALNPHQLELIAELLDEFAQK